MTTTEKIRWSDNMLVGFKPMDDEHHAFVEMIERMQNAAADELAPLLDQFAVVADAHFDSENKMMEETQFPPRQCHIDEHMAVLKSVAEVRELLAEGQHEYDQKRHPNPFQCKLDYLNGIK
jgi:hemerythrin-like metal-binding protein